MSNPNIKHTLNDWGYYLANNDIFIFCPILPGNYYYLAMFLFKLFVAYPIYFIYKLLKNHEKRTHTQRGSLHQNL